MTREEKVEILQAAICDKTESGCTLKQRPSRNFGTVWAAICRANHYPHKYTLAHGVACWRWWHTLDEIAEDLGVQFNE